MQSASDEFSGHCLALTLLGSYLTDAYNGDIRCRKEVSERLAHDVRQGVHARKVMESYQTWFGEGPELSVLRMLGLFDRPADEKALGALLKPPAIQGITESLIELSPTERRTILGKLRRARLLAGEDPHNPGHLDTHPLVREYFGEQLRSQRTEAWKECNRRLYDCYRTLAPQLPGSFRDMEPLFLAVICGCNAGLFREACMKFTFREFSKEMPASLPTFSEPEEHCSRFWFISSNGDVGIHPSKWASRGRVSRRKTSSLSSRRRDSIYLPRKDWEHRRREFVTSARSPCAIRSIVPCCCIRH